VKLLRRLRKRLVRLYGGLLLWLYDRHCHLVAWLRMRRAFDRHRRLSPAAQQRLRDTTKRRTP